MNVSFLNVHLAVSIYDIDNLTVSESSFKNLDLYGIQARGFSDYGQVRSCTFRNVSYPITMSDTGSNWTIDSSDFRYSSHAAIRSMAGNNNYVNITNSYFEGNQFGVQALYSDYWAIIGNTFRWNEEYGIYIDGMSGPVIYENTFVGNKIENGYDTGNNFWDDGVDTGNAWDDYSGSGVYPIPGGTSQDRYPAKYLPTTPIISNPLDVAYPEGTDDFYVSWNVYDDYLVSWEVTVDGTLWASGAWNYNNVSVNVGGLAYGDYLVVVTVYDLDANNATDSIIVHVYDGTAPTVEGVLTMTAFVGASDQFVVWNVSDNHPTNYSIYVDDVVSAEGSWATGQITFDVSSFAAGDHEVKLTVRDIDMNEASQTVTVRMVVDSTSPTIDSPSDLTIYYGSTGNNIVWTPYDLYPYRYEVVLNGTTMASGDWNGEKIIVNVDGLDLGSHVFTLTVYDGADNSVSDSVNVTVVSPPWHPSSTTTVTPPAVDSLLIMLIILGVGGAVAVVVIFYFLKKRRAA